MPDDSTSRRKDDHLDLCARQEVEPAQNRTLLECVQLIHCALPELALEELSVQSELWGKPIRLPLCITGMTGGTDRAGEVNRDLATLAERHGLIFGVGSQRAMSEAPARAKSFQVRSVAPHVLLLGNIGLRQASALGKDGVRRLRDAIGADGMALHLNAAQELTQPEGDRDFRGGYATIQQLVTALEGRLLVKETGCGISPAVARRLVELGVELIDVSGLGGTSWVRVEQLRAQGLAAEVGAQFSGWGIPTAAAVATVRRAVAGKARLVASGGLRTGLELARALALGADFGGMALPFFRAQQDGGLAKAEETLQGVIRGLKQAMVLTGCRSLEDLRRAPRVITGDLKDWLATL